jgi:hypothetical protein
VLVQQDLLETDDKAYLGLDVFSPGLQ